MRAALFETPRPAPGKLIPALGGALVIALALPVFLLIAISVMNPGYMDPMFTGWGFAWLAASAVSVATGIVIINKMVKVEV